MWILHAATYLRAGGGIQTHILELSAWLRSHGHSVFLAGHGHDREYLAGQAIAAVPLHQVSAFQSDGGFQATPCRAWAIRRSVLALMRPIRRERIDLIHVHETAPLLIAWLATRRPKLPIVYTYHGAEGDRLPALASMAQRTAGQLISPRREACRRWLRSALRKPGRLHSAWLSSRCCRSMRNAWRRCGRA